MKKITLGVIATVLFGKLFPLILLALVLIGLAVIIGTAVKEGKQL